MNRQSAQAKLLAVSLFSLSAIGTIALFGSVPVIARMLSSNQPVAPAPAQVFPKQPIVNPKQPVAKLLRAVKPD